MRVRLVFLALSSVSCASWLFLQGCGGSDNSLVDGSDDGTVGSDATPDTNPPQDSGNDTSTDDTGAPDTGGDASDGGQSNMAFRCGNDGGTVTDCAQCTGAVQPCVYCQNTDASVLQGVCTAIHTNCFNSLPNGFVDCACADASTCPESYQVCPMTGNAGRCHTCSDQQGNNTLKCENGGTCDYADGGCL